MTAPRPVPPAAAAGPRLRVAAVMDTNIVSGPGRQLAAVAPALAAHGVDVRVVVFQYTGAPKTPYRAFLEAAGVDHVVVPFASRFDRALLPALRRALAEWAPDVVQTHGYRPTTLAWLLRRAGAPWRWVGFFHGATNEDFKVRVYHWLDRQLLPWADRLVVMSRVHRDYFGPRVARSRRLVQIYNAVIPTGTHTAGAPAAVAALPRPRVGVVGRLSHEKGVDVLLEAFGRVRAAHPAASLVVAGDGPERAALEAQAARLGLAEAVTFLGTVLPVEPLYPALDVVVLPSRSEGLPNVMLEALRADVPVVATRVGAVPEVLEGTEAGHMVAPNDPAALANAILASLDTAGDPVRGPAAARARADVVRRFSLDTRVRAHRDLYDAVLAEARR